MHVIDDAMPLDFSAELSRWIDANRRLFVRGGDEAGEERFNYEVTDVEQHFDGMAPFQKTISERYPEALDACFVDDFDLRFVEMHATCHHHENFFVWHDDACGYDGRIVETRRLTFCYYMHTDPKMFSGGELEFLDGTRVEPKNNRLVFFHPLQQHQVRRVECWSARPLHGRWALMGWIHGDPPPGYREAVPQLRGRPYSG